MLEFNDRNCIPSVLRLVEKCPKKMSDFAEIFPTARKRGDCTLV